MLSVALLPESDTRRSSENFLNPPSLTLLGPARTSRVFAHSLPVSFSVFCVLRGFAGFGSRTTEYTELTDEEEFEVAGGSGDI